MNFDSFILKKYRDLKFQSNKHSVPCCNKLHFVKWAKANSKIKIILARHAISNSIEDRLCIYRLNPNLGYVIGNIAAATRGELSRIVNYRIVKLPDNKHFRHDRTPKRLLARIFEFRLKDSKIRQSKFISKFLVDPTFKRLYRSYKKSGYVKIRKPRLIVVNKLKPATLGNIMFTSKVNNSKV